MYAQKIQLLILLLFNFLFCIAQEKQIINGEVYCEKSNSPIGFASVTIKGKPIGTSTNELGQFSLRFPESYLNDTLHISSLGYKSYSNPVRIVISDSIHSFFLDTINIPLQSVYVLSDGKTAKQIVDKAIKNTQRNYPTRLYFLEGFYRELSMRDDRYARLIEAAVSIQDYGYDTDLESTRIRIDQLRKSDSHLQYDRRSKTYSKFFDDINMIIKTYSTDYIRAKHNCRHTNFLCNENIERFEFSIVECKYNDDGLVYQISFRDTSLNSIIKNRSGYFEGALSIQSENYAILKMEYGMVALDSKPNHYFFKDKYLTHNSITFKRYRKKYYPEVFQSIFPFIEASIANPSDTAPGRQYIVSTLMINNIITRRRDFARIKNSEKEQPKVDIYKKKFPYNPEFWENYNMLLLNPNLKSVMHDLEIGIPLEQQFKLNGK